MGTARLGALSAASACVLLGALGLSGVLFGALVGALLLGFGIGLGVGITLGGPADEAGSGARAAPRARPDGAASDEADSSASGRLYPAQGSTCKRCRRPLLPGMATCPFCNPTIPTAGALEQTVHQEYQGDRAPVALPGLAAATRLMLEAGALGFLHVFEGASKGQSILLSNTSVKIGRAPDNHVILNDPGVSQHHVEVRPEGRGFRLKDLDSKNGTFVNDQRVAGKLLASGDVLGVGASRLFVQLR